ncbi:MAG: A/G-specific adenine glycosylase [Candidatus Ruminococcus intestinipullorum]|nr:A/G-specific adenine glycosylase [Candidatus Ruminococcus intestinipullorum]
MKYERIKKGKFLERPNRFIAHAEIEGKKEVVHVKNTGRCLELLIPEVEIYVQESENPNRKTKWDLISVRKGERLINMDSQVTNQVVKEWILEGNLFSKEAHIRMEVKYGSSRFDLYVEDGSRKAFIEVKGVTLEDNGRVLFPDAPSERAVKHLEELAKAVKDGYEAYVFFVIQMKGVKYFTPNMNTHPEFGETLRKVKELGVQILAYDCIVEEESIQIADLVPVVLGEPLLKEIVEPLVTWYRENHRDLPWRNHVTAYRVWVSEIMLQQTRVEAVKPYYERFLKELPSIQALAEVPEDRLLKLWEGLGYYNRVRNMQKAACQMLKEYQGEFPNTYEEIRNLPGIGNYTAGAISSFAFGIPKPAVDGNVLRVVARILASREDIMKASVRGYIEKVIEEIIPIDAPSDFNQGLIELGATICVPNGEPKCIECPVSFVCRARKEGIAMELPKKTKAKARKEEKRTVFVFQDGEGVAIRKRPKKGLLAGLYELPNIDGWLKKEEAIEYSKSLGIVPIHIKKLPKAKHIFSHVEWDMIGYEIKVDQLERNCNADMLFVKEEELKEKYSIPSAFEAYCIWKERKR